MEFIQYPDSDMMMIDLASTLVEELSGALKHEERVSIAVAGGTTPTGLYEALSGARLDWSRVDIMLTDERWVPETSERSNTQLLRKTLLTGPAAAARYLPLYLEAETPEGALPNIRAAIGPVLPLTIAVLGMGEDMHTASLFPGADLLEAAFNAHAPLVLPMRAPGAGEPRVTLTAPVLHGAMSTHVLITGDAKRAALERARAINNPMEAPISAFLSEAVVHWAQ